ncbi:MAG: FAD binding domain-containing protein, partial [Butyricicoccus sp.]
MLTINHYVRPQSLDEAYALCQKKSNVVLGGMLWLKMQNKTVDTAIDLCDLGLDTIEETEDAYRIGAMVTLRDLEQHAGLCALTQGAIA